MSALWPERVRVSPDVLVQELDGEMVLLDLKSERYYGLDAVGGRMWALLAEHGEPGTVCARLVTEFDADEGRIRRDLAALIARLVEAGLMRIEPPVSPSVGTE